MNKRFVGLATSALVTVGLAGFGLASGAAQAEPGPFPAYHWCPGEFWDPGWGDNWEGGECHDDFHRDRDGWDHSRDFRPSGDRGWQGDQGDRGGPWQPWQPQPWQPPWQPPWGQ